jgi:hypothetical protein
MMERESVPEWVEQTIDKLDLSLTFGETEHLRRALRDAYARAVEDAALAIGDLEPIAWAEDGDAPAESCVLQVRAMSVVRQLLAGQRSASAAPAAGVDVEALSTAVPVAEHKWVGPMDPWCDKCGRDYLDARNQPCAKVNISKTCYPAVREDGPTRESERARLVAEVGECCLGSDPLCSDGCLVEHALAKRREARIPPAGAGAFRSEAGPTCHGCGLPSILGCDCPPAEQIVKDLRLIRSGQTVEYEWWKRTLDTAIAALASRLAPPKAEQT